MEDLLAFILVGTVLAVLALAVKYTVRYFRIKTEKRLEEQLAEHKRQLEATRKWREGLYEKSRKAAEKNTPPKKTVSTSNVASTSTTRTYQSADPSDLADFATMLALNSALNSSSGVSRIDVDYVTDTVRVTTSDDIRSSWSSSSSDSSSSWSSSSDSGPSSDW